MSIDTPELIDELTSRAHRDVDSGQIPACSLALAYRGEIVVSEAFGYATPKSLFVIQSASKPIVDSALWLLLGEGRLTIGDAVADHIPEFGSNGKDHVTVEQLMTHTGGFPQAPIDWPQWADRQYRLDTFASWTLEFDAGSRYAYHPTSASWVIAELIERISGLDFRDFLRQRVFTPLKLADSMSLGAPVSYQEQVLSPVFLLPEETLRQLPPQMATLGPDGTAIVPAGLATPEGREAGFPGAGVVATAEAVALIYQAFLHNPGTLWDPNILADATGKVRVGLPDEHGIPVQRTLSMVTAGDVAGRTASRAFFGPSVSPGTFGHLGLGGNFGWADPESGLSFSYLTNGIAFLPGFPDFDAYNRAEQISSLAGRIALTNGGLRL